MNEDYATKEELKLTNANFEPHNLSKKICEAIKQQVDINNAIKGIVAETIKKDVETQNLIKNIIYSNWKLFVVYGLPILALIANVIVHLKN